MTPKRRYRLWMTVPLFLVLLNGWIAYRALAKLFNAQDWLAHTLEVRTQAAEVYLSMSSANSAARAYLLTAQPEFSSRYEAATREVYAGTNRLQALTEDNASQQARIAVLRKRISIKLGALDAAMAMRRSHPSDALSLTALHPALADSPDGGISVKYGITQIEAEEDRLLSQREAEAGAARRFTAVSFAGALLLDVALLVIAFQQLINARRDREELSARALEIHALNGRLSGVNAQLSALNAELEQRVEERTRELEVSNQELQAFSYSVSHDLRAPLRTIDGFSLALAEDFSDVLNAEGRDYIQRVRGGVQRMGMLIDALLQLSRVTRSEVQREAVDLSKLATLVFGELMATETDRDVEISVQPEVVANADPRLMRVAFENLIGNALKFTSKTAGARVEFGQTAGNGETVYFIRDNGAGFDMQYVDRLFTAFQRLHGDRDFKGSGIGLATVSRIVRRHHGRIWAEGAIGAGATFSFTLGE
ncbi:MAG TPA: ATP-binding protein [Acidobacteriaceae bacterium]|nr:ATP-binding protein [Acidobacteriaceae bacterium]